MPFPARCLRSQEQTFRYSGQSVFSWPADRQDALVVALTADGTTYLHADRVPMPDLANRVRSTLSTQKDKTLYIKADARVPYARLVDVMDAVQKSGVQGLTFLTAQQDAADQGKRPVSPKGLELRVR